jgi:hypothetical protein
MDQSGRSARYSPLTILTVLTRGADDHSWWDRTRPFSVKPGRQTSSRAMPEPDIHRSAALTAARRNVVRSGRSASIPHAVVRAVQVSDELYGSL